MSERKLDLTGVQYLWNKIKATFALKTDVPSASTTTPGMDSTTGQVGSLTTYARGDHTHPKDTSKADINSPALTGTPTAPTANVGTNNTQLATTAFVKNAIDNINMAIYQRKLTAGRNIEITANNVINGVDLSPIQQQISDLSDDIIEVEANPSGTPTQDLTKLRVADVIYKLAEGGGDANISYGTEEPSSGSDGDVYLQIYGKTEIRTPSFAHQYISQTALSQTDNKLNITLAGTKAGTEAYVAYKISGLVPNTKYGVKFKATYTGDTSTSDSNKFGLFVAEEYTFNNTNAYYVELTKDNAEHEYTLFFDSENEEAVMWFQFGGLANGEMSLEIEDMWLLGLEVGSSSYALAYYDKWTAFTQNSFERTSGGYQFDLTVRTDSTAEWICYKLTGLTEGARYKVAFSEQMTGISSYYGGTHKFGIFIDDEFMIYTSSDAVKKKCAYIPFEQNNSKAYYEAEYISHGTEEYLWVQTGALSDGGTANIIIEDMNITPISPYEPNLKIKDIWLNQNTVWINSDFSTSGGGTVTDIQIDSTSILDAEGIANIPTMLGATSSTDGVGGLVPQPLMADAEKFLCGDGTWKTVQGGGGSGGSGYEETVLYDTGITPSSSVSTITLNDDVTNYDVLMFDILWSSYPTVYRRHVYLSVSELILSNSQEYILYLMNNASTTISLLVRFPTTATAGLRQVSNSLITKLCGIYGLKFGGGGSSSIDYSTEEQVIGTWIDGKPLYQKTIIQEGTYRGNATVTVSTET